MKTTFKVLMFAGAFMDERHLGKGLYETSTPVLHPADETIESMIEKHLQVTQRGTSIHESHKSFMNNLAKCSLVEVNLEVVENPVLPVENNPAGNLENSEAESDVDAMLPNGLFEITGDGPIHLKDPAGISEKEQTFHTEGEVDNNE